MARPLMQHGVGQLEEMFAKGRVDPKVLKQLENELQYRQVPRAVALLTEVQGAMYSGSPTRPAAPVAPSTSPTTMPLFSPIPQPEPVARPVVPSAAQPGPPLIAPVPPKPPAPSSMAIPLEDAYKLLKATPASAWESIEQTRRLLVQQAHPSRVAPLSAEKRVEARTDAARVNAAYLRLSAARCSN